MDRAELKKLLKPFQELCAEKGKPLYYLDLRDALPGCIPASYWVEVKATWFSDMSCFDILDFLYDILWETTDVNTRRNVFLSSCSIQKIGTYLYQKKTLLNSKSGDRCCSSPGQLP